jgi:uncharacterized protein YukE
VTDIKVDPAALHGVAASIAASRGDVDACATAFDLARSDLSSGLAGGADGGGIATLAQAVDEFCRAYKQWFHDCGEAVAALALKSSSAADTFTHVDEQNAVPAPP